MLGMNGKASLEGELRGRLEELTIIDTHEHIMSPEEVKREPIDALRVFGNGYARLDFISAGMAPEIWEDPDGERLWTEFERFQEAVQYTTYFRVAVRALKDLYGMQGDVLTEDSWRDLSEQVRQAYGDPTWYRRVLSRAGITRSLLDTFWSVERFTFNASLFAPVLRTNPFILGRQYVSPFPRGRFAPSSLEAIASAWGADISELDGFLHLVDQAFDRYQAAGAAAVKIATAYERTLAFAPVGRDRAARLYAEDPAQLSGEERKQLGDYVARYIISAATERELPVQVHTGILARHGNILANSNPEHLNPLFLEFPATRFVLLHLGYPYVGQALALAKMFPNVYLDFSWVPVLSPQTAVTALHRFLDLVPANKLTWGGDAYRVEDAYAAAYLFRDCLAKVLAERVAAGDMDQPQALAVARAFMSENALRLYRLQPGAVS